MCASTIWRRRQKDWKPKTLPFGYHQRSRKRSIQSQPLRLARHKEESGVRPLVRQAKQQNQHYRKNVLSVQGWENILIREIIGVTLFVALQWHRSVNNAFSSTFTTQSRDLVHLGCGNRANDNDMYVYVCMYVSIYIYIYRVSREECTRLRENVPYVKVYRYNPKTPISNVERLRR